MLKKLIVASACMMAFATGGFAEKLTKTPVDLEIYGDLESYYKLQTDYRTPLDSSDYQESINGEEAWSDGFDFRSGANNRSQQNVRAHGALTMVSRAGENKYGDTTWYNFIGVAKLTMDANDPDDNTEFDKDGAMVDKVKLGDVWVRYAPAVMLGIKVGTQTIAQTANAYAIGHKFVGDKDDDFIFYTAAVADEKPGISLDLHLSEDIELGVAMLQGMGDMSMILVGGSAKQAKNNAFWFQGKFGMFEAVLGYQAISVGGLENDATSDDANLIINQWLQEESHTMTNFVFKVDLGAFKPFFAYQAGAGNAVSNTDLSALETLNDYIDQLDAIVPGLTKYNNVRSDTQKKQFTTMGVGVIGDIGPGKLAFDYVSINTPEWGEEGYVEAGLEMDSAMHLNYGIDIAEGATITFFYNAFNAKEDSKLRSDMDAMRDNPVLVAEQETTLKALLGDASYTELIAGFNQANKGNNLGTFTQTSSSSFGVSLQMKFGN